MSATVCMMGFDSPSYRQQTPSRQALIRMFSIVSGPFSARTGGSCVASQSV